MQEYVIVLLRNGRHKEEAKKELNVFLGDDSDSFVNWYPNSIFIFTSLNCNSVNRLIKRGEMNKGKEERKESKVDCVRSCIKGHNC